MKDFYSCIHTKFFFTVVLVSSILLGIFLRLLPHIVMGFSSNLPLNNGGLYLFFSEIIAQNNFSYPTFPHRAGKFYLKKRLNSYERFLFMHTNEIFF